MNKLLLIIALMTMTSCGGLPVDNTPAPIDKNFYSLDLELCGEISYGLGGCAWNKGEDLSKKFLTVNLHHKGNYTVRSSGCNFEKRQEYDEDQRVSFTFEELLEGKPDETKTCAFSVMMRPEGFDKSMRANFLIYDQEEFNIEDQAEFNGRSFKNGVAWLQIRAGGNRATAITFATTGKGEVVYQGCGVNGSKGYDGVFNLSLDELLEILPLEVNASCDYTVFLIPNSGEPRIFMISLRVYDRQYIHLANPVLRFDGEKLKVKADEVVGVVAINDKFKYNSRKVSRKVGSDMVWVRQATANGRTTLLGVKEGKIVWEPLVE